MELVPINSTGMTVPEEMPQLDHILAGRLSSSSIAMYKRDMIAYTSYTEEYNISWIEPKSLVAWRDDLVINTTMSPNTINRMLSSVKRVVKEMDQRDMIDSTISMKFDRVEGIKERSLKERLKENSRTRISKEDMRRLCESPDEESILGKRDRAILATLASSGIRASELATLTFKQIVSHSDGYTLLVRGKTDIKHRDAHLSKEAYEKIELWQQSRPLESPYIFTSFSTRAAIANDHPMSESAVWRIVRKYAKQCDLEHIKPHDFRRFVGTQLAKTNIRDAQNALGHQSIETTARHYVLDTLKIGLTDNLY